MRFVIRAAVVAGIVALSNVPSAQTDLTSERGN
jgi:hypothetical protein